jgi:protein-S-isoprenylcysteine O-methyltransferase Ste14/uncharacterized membrane protein (UPF0127 family)
MYRVQEAAGGAVLGDRVRSAHTHLTRLRGLLGTRTLPPGHGLWLRPCRQVHMIGMRYAVDVLFLDDVLTVVHAIAGLAPGTLSPKVPAATSVLELPAGTLARVGVAPGARLAIEADAAAPPSRLEGLGPIALNVLLAAFYALFAWAHVHVALETGGWSTTLPIVMQETLLVGLFLARRRSVTTSSRARDWAIGIAGTFLPLLMRPTEQPSALAVVGRPKQIAGLALAVVAVASLGRSIGVVAANRGVQTGGLYRLIRHPLYAAHSISYVGYLACYPRAWNAMLVATTLLAMRARAVAEEELLAADATYRAYLGRTRWRFIPGVY